MPPTDPMTPQRLLQKALANIDWGQVVANGGPPCFHVEDGRFCLRAARWDGHRGRALHHGYVSLEAVWSNQLERNAEPWQPTTVNVLGDQLARAGAKRLLETEAEILSMPKQQRDWFMSKPGHADAFNLARYVLSLPKPPEAK